MTATQTTSGQAGVPAYDLVALRNLIEFLQPDFNYNLRHSADVSRVRWIADALYPASRESSTTGTAGPLSFNQAIALSKAQSVEAVLGAARPRIPQALIDRLRYLRSFDAPPVRGRDPMAHTSLRHALMFLLNNPELPDPRVTVTPAGHILFEWPRSPYRYLAIEFLTREGDAYFVFIQGNKRLRGRSDIREIADTIPLTAIRRWYHGAKKHSSTRAGSRS